MTRTEKIRNIVAEAGDMMLRATDILKKTVEKSDPHDLVTAYDLEIQSFLFDRLKKAFPGAEVLGEEGEGVKSFSGGECFVIDPIDGTANFVHGLRQSAVSVGLLQDGRPAAGVIYNPYAGEMFWAEAGRGAWLNGSPIRVSSLGLAASLVYIGTSPYRRDLADKTFALTRALYDETLDIRRSGSAALDLCSVACGRAGLFFELILSPWDFCAGALIVGDAGGLVTDIAGGALPFDRPAPVLAGNPVAHAAFLRRYEALTRAAGQNL